jgi:4-hydroxy-2-oxoheptanedioate aldolase
MERAAARDADHETFRARASRGERVLGTVLASPDVALAEMVAGHFDFVWIDLEHSPLTVRDVQSLCIAARASRCATLVRLPDVSSVLVTALLDIGVDGLIAPRVEDVGVAERFACSLRYPPEGSRGFAHRRFTSYGLDSRSPSSPARAPLCLIQIESAVAVGRAQELAAVEGVDGLVVGPSDLALDLGVGPALDGRELSDAIASVQRAARGAGVISGLAAGGSPDVVIEALGGSTLLAFSADVRIYAQAIEGAASSMSAAWRAGVSACRGDVASVSRSG